MFDYKTDECFNSNDERQRLVKDAAKIIKSDIYKINTSRENYPLSQDISSIKSNINLLPETLKCFLKELCSGKDTDLKLAAIGQAIIQAAKPRILILPLQIGLAIQLHHQFGSRFLIEIINKLGFCSPYQEVQKYESNAAVSRGVDIPGNIKENFIQYIADNVDHNTRTIDGHNTFHGMGIIAGITPVNKGIKPVPRVNVTSDDVAAVGRINIHIYKSNKLSLSSLFFGKMANYTTPAPMSKLLLFSKIYRTLDSRQPGWSGMMQLIHHGMPSEKSSVVFMPMIDMNPSGISCVYSTLIFKCDQAKKYDITPIVTFDQPLWWKATIIMENEPQNSKLKNIVLRLGGFYTQMSYLGCIGHIMTKSGLEEILETIYAKSVNPHILSGKAVSRAVRAHFLVENVLNSMILSIYLMG